MSAVAVGYWLLGEVESAAQTFAEARTLHEQTGNVDGLLGDRLWLGQVFMLHGKLHEAAAAYQQVIEQAALWRGLAIEAMIHRAEVLYEWNALEEAEARLSRAITEADQVIDDVLLARGILSLAYAVQACIRQARGEKEQASALFTQAVTLALQRGHARFVAQTQALQVCWWLAQGHREAVTRWREGYPDVRDAAPTYEEEPGALTLARVLLAEGEAGEALRLLERFRALARTQGRLDSELKILLLSALAQARRGKMEPAVQHLGQALSLAEPEGYVRLFLDEGLPLAPLLRLVLTRWQGQRRAHYVQQLLTLLEAEHPQQAGSALAHDQAARLPPQARRISARELAVLRGLAEGLSTPQMAARLVVSPNTIKTQLASLYRKLDVRTRQEAIAEAVRLHLL
jgi:LuxR family maltose regulon positive regulatory protein